MPVTLLSYVPYLQLPEGGDPAAMSCWVKSLPETCDPKVEFFIKMRLIAFLVKGKKYPQQRFLPIFSSLLGKCFSSSFTNCFHKVSGWRCISWTSAGGELGYSPLPKQQGPHRGSFQWQVTIFCLGMKKGRWVEWIWVSSWPEMFCTWPCFCFSLKEWF